MKIPITSSALFVLLVVSTLFNFGAAARPAPFLDNFKVVVDKKAYRNNGHSFTNLNQSFKLPTSDFDFDAKAMIDNIKREAGEIGEKLWAEVNAILEKIQSEVKEAMKNMDNYSKLEIGAYAALALSLTIAMKILLSNKSTSKTLDIGLIDYILSSPAANSQLSNTVTVKELQQRKLTLRVSPSISSVGGKTYRMVVPKAARKPPRTITPPPPPPPARPAQVVVDTVTAFYEEYQAYPASHNAVINTMSPEMRHRLRARRIRGGATQGDLTQTLLVGFYFAAWYALNIVYNIVNKKVLNVLPAPLMVGTVQFAVGALYCSLVWLFGIRPYPQLTASGKKSVAGVGLYHSLGQLASMVSLGAGPVSFTHIVKAMEPFFSALVSGLVFNKWMKPQVYATLIPVVGGVGYACLKELNFSWVAFLAAMASNVAFALRAVMSKLALQSGKETGTNLSPPNMFGLVTWAAFLISIPIALIGEGAGFGKLLSESLESVESDAQFFRAVIISGLFHYLNNEVMYLALGSVHPVTLAVGNTMKRVFILVASVMVFRNPISVQAGIGSGVGIAGVLLYSLTKQYYENLETAALEAQKAEVEKKGRNPFAKATPEKTTSTKKVTKKPPSKKPIKKSPPQKQQPAKRQVPKKQQPAKKI